MNATVHIIALVLSTLLYISNSESCGSRDDTKPQLRITIADVENAGTDEADEIFVRVLYGRNIKQAVWSDWQDVNTVGCDDLNRGQTDYFDLDLCITIADVENAGTDEADEIFVRVLYGRNIKQAVWSDWQDVNTVGCDDLNRGQTDYFDLDLGSTEQWLAIAFYSIGGDGMLVDSLGYWDGTAPQHLDYFCGLIGGPFYSDSCFEDADTTNSLCDNPVSTEAAYDAFWVDKTNPDNCFVSINLNAKRGVGTAFSLDSPGTPANPRLYSSGSLLNNAGLLVSSYVDTIGGDYWMNNVLIIAVLSAIMFVCQYYYFKRKYADAEYKPLNDV
eukprot:890962_1